MYVTNATHVYFVNRKAFPLSWHSILVPWVSCHHSLLTVTKRKCRKYWKVREDPVCLSVLLFAFSVTLLLLVSTQVGSGLEIGGVRVYGKRHSKNAHAFDTSGFHHPGKCTVAHCCMCCATRFYCRLTAMLIHFSCV